MRAVQRLGEADPPYAPRHGTARTGIGITLYYPDPMDGSDDSRIPGQIPVGELSDQIWDTAIIGAGPAGSSAAMALARRGHRVLLLDRARFPRDKVCGDALIPDALHCLSALGLEDDVRAFGHAMSIISIYSAARVRLDIPASFVTVKRLALDAFLAARAVQAGACLVHARVTALRSASNGVELELAGRQIPVRARTALTATGAHVDLLDAHGLLSQPRASAMALRCYVRSPERIEELVISYDGSIAPGYAWIFPLGGGEYNVGCGRLTTDRSTEGMNLRRDMRTFIDSFPMARALMSRATSVSKLQGAMLRCGLVGTKPVGPGPSLAAGEAIGATFPLTGEGIGKAMETALMAADALDRVLTTGGDSELTGFESRLRRELTPRYFGYEVAQRWLAWPRLGDFVLRRAQRSGYLRRAIEGILNETVDPRTVFSVRGLARSWLPDARSRVPFGRRA
jgi:geranylgeranyl reductase family protein